VRKLPGHLVSKCCTSRLQRLELRFGNKEVWIFKLDYNLVLLKALGNCKRVSEIELEIYFAACPVGDGNVVFQILGYVVIVLLNQLNVNYIPGNIYLR